MFFTEWMRWAQLHQVGYARWASTSEAQALRLLPDASAIIAITCVSSLENLLLICALRTSYYTKLECPNLSGYLIV